MSTRNLLAVTILLMSVVSCEERPIDKSTITTENKASLPVKDHLSFRTPFPSASVESDSLNYMRISPCDTARNTVYAHSSDLAKGIARGQGLDLNDDMGALAIVDSLNSYDAQNRDFYFWIVGRSLKYADGYYGEAVSSTAYSLFEKRPCEFLGHFVNSDCITPSELGLWSGELGFEFFLDSEEVQSEKFAEVQKWMRDKCKTCTGAERGIAEKILTQIKRKTEASIHN